MLEIKNVTKSFDRPLFKEMSMTFQETGMYVIVGKSGSGKSTLLNILGGLDNEYQGVIEIDGQDIRQIPHYIRKYIGFIFQQFYLIEEMNVKENVNLISYFKRIMISKKEYYLERLKIKDLQRYKTAILSGGQKQRVAIAGIVAMRPSILILDEATSMLDPEGRQELIQSIKAIRKEYGMTVLSITHDLDEVALSDRVLVLKKGKVESVSSPRELFSRGSELVDLGLDIPFSALLTQKLKNQGLIDCEGYLTEKELVEQLWEYLSKM